MCACPSLHCNIWNLSEGGEELDYTAVLCPSLPAPAIALLLYKYFFLFDTNLFCLFDKYMSLFFENRDQNLIMKVYFFFLPIHTMDLLYTFFFEFCTHIYFNSYTDIRGCSHIMSAKIGHF